MVKGTIEVEHMSKTFKKGNVQAVKDVSFSVKEGEFFAFLGPNGAGKSTTVQILTTLINASSGKALVAEQDVIQNPKEVRKYIWCCLAGNRNRPWTDWERDVASPMPDLRL